MMGPGDAIAVVAVAGVAIGFLITIGTTLHKWIEYKRHRAELELQARGAVRSERNEAYNDLLEERVRVLERIATDRGVDLALRIEELREPAWVESAPKQRSDA
ncbi:hypothetical protein GRI89_03100 [Altererythrobacter salegens]|uniref:Phage shock protein B n=1 Tax=Croceibacterium salegens TaxID=1737568 RepID=A0A6I4SU93_9SPHN|nr:hypothetical protein [Croceibacterium salegens]MXO58530.1 hypothetical protein [Croceibacterium salegens]